MTPIEDAIQRLLAEIAKAGTDWRLGRKFFRGDEQSIMEDIQILIAYIEAHK